MHIGVFTAGHAEDDISYVFGRIQLVLLPVKCLTVIFFPLELFLAAVE